MKQGCDYEKARMSCSIIFADGYLPDEKPFPSKYAFYQDYNVVTKEDANSNTKAFADFAMSPEGREIAASLKHIRAKE